MDCGVGGIEVACLRWGEEKCYSWDLHYCRYLEAQRTHCPQPLTLSPASWLIKRVNAGTVPISRECFPTILRFSWQKNFNDFQDLLRLRDGHVLAHFINRGRTSFIIYPLKEE